MCVSCERARACAGERARLGARACAGVMHVRVSALFVFTLFFFVFYFCIFIFVLFLFFYLFL